MADNSTADKQLKNNPPERKIDEDLSDHDRVMIYLNVLKTISLLPEGCRQAFYLSKVHGLSNKEVAVYMKCSVKTVKKYLSIGVRYIRKDIERWRRVVSRQ